MMQLSEKTGIKQNVLQAIIKLAKDNDVRKLILFGSRARGDYKERSDIDLAFYGGNSSRWTKKLRRCYNLTCWIWINRFRQNCWSP